MNLTRPQIISLKSAGVPDTIQDNIYKYQTLNNDGSTSNAAVNGSVTPQEFIFQPDAGRVALAVRMIMYLEDAGNFRVQDYGAITGSLSNGVTVGVYDSDDVLLYQLTDLHPITTNGGWSRMCYDVTHFNYGSGNEVISARWTFEKAGYPVLLRDGDQLKTIINDNLTGLVEHTFMIQGYYL